MRTSQVAEQAGVNVQTLRYYERRGLLPEPPRGESGYRVYDVDAVRRVRFIKLADAKLAELDERIADLRAMRDSLRRLAATCARPRAERECPLLHSIEEAADER